MKNFMAVFLLFGVGLWLLGCNSAKLPQGMPDLVPAKLTITQEGKPLADAEVALCGSTWNIFGTSDAKGVVVLRTYQYEIKGAPHGEYIVTVSKAEHTPSEFGETPPPENRVVVAEWTANREAEYRPSYDLVDPALKDQRTSTLRVKITASGAEPATIEVGSAVHEIFIPPGSASAPGANVKIPAAD